MARYRKVDPRIWNDTKFQAVSDDAKLLFLFTLTHPHSTSLGAFRATLPGLSAELRWKEERCREAFSQLTTRDMIEHDELAGFIGLPNFLKYNRPESPNVVRSWSESFDLIPECELKNRLLLRMKAFAEGLGEAFQEAFRDAFVEGTRPRSPSLTAKPSPIQEQKPEPEQKQKQEQKKTPRDAVVAEETKAVVDAWNAIEGIHHVRNVTSRRLVSIKLRLADPDWHSSWESALEKISSSSFCKGGGNRGWKADIDWFLRPDTVTQILEGKYDDAPPKLNGVGNGGSLLFDSLRQFADSALRSSS